MLQGVGHDVSPLRSLFIPQHPLSMSLGPGVSEPPTLRSHTAWNITKMAAAWRMCLGGDLCMAREKG